MRSKVPGMTSSPEPTAVRFDADSFWVDLDEDISVAGLLAGRGDMSRPRKKAA